MKDLNARSVLFGLDHRLQPLDHAGFDEDARHIRRQCHVGHTHKDFALQVREPPRAPGLFGPHGVLLRRHAAALRVALDERDKAFLEEPATLSAQAPACHSAALRAPAKPPVEQDAAGIEVQVAYQAEVLFHLNV